MHCLWTKRTVKALFTLVKMFSLVQATIQTMLLNEKNIQIYSFWPFSPWNTKQMHLRGVLWQKTVPPHDPLKYPTLASFPPLAASKDNTESDHEPKLHSEI